MRKRAPNIHRGKLIGSHGPTKVECPSSETASHWTAGRISLASAALAALPPRDNYEPQWGKSDSPTYFAIDSHLRI